MKGHLCLKSGPYATTSSKYTTQLLVKANLDAHHRMIRQAKPAIDNKPPRACSVKVKDQLKRDMIKNGRPPPRRTPEPNTYYPEDTALDSSYYRPRSTTPDATLSMGRPHSAPSHRAQSPAPGAKQLTSTPKQPGQPASPRPASGDVLDARKHVFTEGKPFTPRTLKTNRKSKLSEMKYYTPPKKTPAATKISTKKTHFSANETQTMTFEPLRSKNLRQSDGNVPKLNITQDEDHMKWLAKQAHHAELREGMGSSRPNSKMNGNLNESTKSLLRSKSLENEEEELKLLDFVNEVTNDVLDRGIYTNRALQSVFDHHMEQNMGKLSVKKMTDALEKLRGDLGLSETNTEARDDVDTASMASSKGSGLERYKRNLDRTLREAELDYSVAKRKHNDTVDEVEELDGLNDFVPEEEIAAPVKVQSTESTNKFLADLPPIPSMQNGDSHYHPPPSIPGVRDETFEAIDEVEEVRSEASAPTRSEVSSYTAKSKGSVFSEQSRKSKASERSERSKISDRSERSRVSEQSERSRGSAQSRITASSERSRISGASATPTEKSAQSDRTKRSVTQSEKSKASVHSQKSNNTAHSDKSKGSIHSAHSRPSTRGKSSVKSSKGEVEVDDGETTPTPSKRSSQAETQKDSITSQPVAAKRSSVSSARSEKSDNVFDEEGKERSVSMSSSKASRKQLDAELDNLETDLAEELARRQDLESLADSEDRSTIVGDDEQLGSTMGSLASENVWMKNPQTFTMTLKPGQLDMTVVKPKPSARKDRRAREESIEEGSRDNSEKNLLVIAPVAPPRGSRSNSARHSDGEADSAAYSDGPDDF